MFCLADLAQPQRVHRSTVPELSNVTLWTGGRNGDEPNSWVWSDGNQTALTYTNWATDEPSGEPSKEKEACIVSGSTEAKKADFKFWYSEPCAVKFSFICIIRKLIT